MIKVSVIIPYFQRESGILRRALESIIKQNLPEACTVDVIVVDDGSPVSAQGEIEGLAFMPPFHLNLIRQANAGVAAARNAGLNAVSESTKYIAFLDSDDSWPDGHLSHGLRALETGNDFYFCDNEREGHHESYFKSCSPVINALLRENNGVSIIPVKRDILLTAILRDFVTQASTVIYNRTIAPDLLFDTAKKFAGEDLVFFMQLASKSRSACFTQTMKVQCGRGINLYFNSLDWNSPGYLKLIMDSMNAHRFIQASVALSADDRKWNSDFIRDCRRKVANQCVKYAIKNKGKLPPEVKKLIQEDKSSIGWLVVCSVQVVLGKLCK